MRTPEAIHSSGHNPGHNTGLRRGLRDGSSLLLRATIWVYRHSLSLFFGRQCRFLPTCSAYADEAIRAHGPVTGTKLAVRRFCRCHPWGGSGFDPVPPQAS